MDVSPLRPLDEGFIASAESNEDSTDSTDTEERVRVSDGCPITEYESLVRLTMAACWCWLTFRLLADAGDTALERV